MHKPVGTIKEKKTQENKSTVSPASKIGEIIALSLVYEENLSTKSLNFWQNAPSNSVVISASCIWAAVSNTS